MKAFISAILAVFTVLALLQAMNSPSTASALGKLNPERSTVMVFPGQVSSVNWHNVGAVTTQDVGEFALYQEFNSSNSAFIEIPLSESESELLLPQTGTTSSSVIQTSSPEASPVINKINQPSSAPVPLVEPEPSTEVQVVEPISTGAINSKVSFGLPKTNPDTFKLSTGLFALLQAVTTTPFTEDEIELVTAATSGESTSSTTLETSVTQTVQDESAPVAVTESSPVENTDSSEPPATVEEMVSTSSSSGTTPERSTTTTDIVASESTTVSLLSSEHTITLRDFGLPPFESGQFIDNLQLRLSLAGQYDAVSEPAYISAKYSFGQFTEQSGLIILDEEISNAINGGYYILPLPSISDPGLLNDLEVTLSFHGVLNNLQSLYVDSAWLEVNTVSYNQQLLKDRLKWINQKQLRHPQLFDFITESVDFSRQESLNMSLRYNSQRNALVRGLRNLLGEPLVKLNQLVVKRSGQVIEVQPEVTITDEGIVNIVFNDSDKQSLQPGTYTIEMEMAEGGVISNDALEFQWGLLSINTNQTEYSIGDVIEVSMGALSPNGNTLCHADLNLYVTHPDGYIDSVPVVQSGQCFGDNVVDVPDYSSQFMVDKLGTYELHLEHVSDSGDVLSHINDRLFVVSGQRIAIDRQGPTRIFPLAPYRMDMKVRALARSFDGRLIERVPNDFEIVETSADIVKLESHTELIWDVALLEGSSKTLSYVFDAPDISPYLFNLGVARLETEEEIITEVLREVQATPSTTTIPVLESVSEIVTTVIFEEHRQWQIASDALQPNTPLLNATTSFDNVVSTITTPLIGGFAATDPDGDPVEYEIQVDDNFDFGTPLFTRQSSNFPGDAGWTAATFTSGATTSYAVQAADALTDGVTYWWRVRARDPSDTNTWSAYTIPRSLSVDTSAQDTKWSQTLGYQFGRGTLSNLSTTTGGVVVAGGTAVPVVQPGFTSNTANSNTLTLTKPSGVQNGDLLLIIVGNEDTTATDQWDGTTYFPTGFTLINEAGDANSDAHVAAFYRVANGTEGATINVPAQASGDYWGFYLRVTGVDTSSPIDVVGADYNGGNLASHPVTGITTGVADTLAFYVLGGDGGDTFPFSVASPWTEGGEVQAGTGGLTAAGTWGTRGMPTAGTTGNATVAMSATDGASGFQFSIKSAVTNSGSIMSPEIDFDWVSGQNAWGDILWNVTEPTNTDSLLRVYYSSASACDTIVPDAALGGNAAGFDVSASNLYINSLSTTTYNRICLQMTLNQATGTTSPILNDWTVRWALPNQAPSLPLLDPSPAFDNLHATTTPVFGGFAAIDLENDALEYEFIIDNDYDFSSPVLTKQSSNYPTDAGWTAATFSAGATTTYTIQPADALTSGTTYWWKVRARDPLGSNDWGEYSEVRSVTIDNSLEKLGWHQTLGYQFERGTLSGLATTTGGVVATTGGGSVPVVQPGFTSNTANSNTLTLTKPSGVQNGDLLLIIVGNEDTTATDQWDGTTYFPTGFTLINEAGDANSDAHVAAFYRVANGTEGATINVPAQASGDYWGFYLRVTGVDTSSPIDVVGADYAADNLANHIVPGVTTINNNALAFYVLGSDGGDGFPFSVASPWTEGGEVQAGTGGLTAAGTWGTRGMPTPGATGNAIVSMSTTDGAAGLQFALKPAIVTSGTIMSPEIDFDWVPGETRWGDITWNVTEPANTNSALRVYYSNAAACDTLIPNGVLPGNSTGFISASSSLIIDSLSTTTYNRICLQMTLNQATGTTSPILNDWTVRFALPNQAPGVPILGATPAFNNYKSTTTTPVIGSFGSSDYDNDNLEYEFIIDNDYDFSSPVLTKQSSNYPTDTGWTAATFSAGATTTYTIQPADALTSGTTYWWKVRARDPLGSNTWSQYSSPRSLTASNAIVSPEWFQTTFRQFSTSYSTTTYVVATTTTTSGGGVVINAPAKSVSVLNGWSTGNTKTISAGTDRVLVVAIVSEDNTTSVDVDTVTYGGQTLTEIQDQQIGTGFSNGMWVGYLNESGIASAAGTTIVPTWVGGTPGNGIAYTSAVFQNVNQTNPVRDSSANALTSGTTITPAAAISVNAGDMMLYIAESDTGLTHTPASGYTEGTEQDTGGNGFVAASAYKAIATAGSEYPQATWSASGNRLLMVAVALQPTPEVGSIMSPEVDFDWVKNQNDWGEVIWHVTEPVGTETLLRVYYTNVTACDTLVPNAALVGNSAGFSSGGSPLDISSLSTSTYNRLCLNMSLSKGSAAVSPALEDWTLSWERSPSFEQKDFWWYNNANTITPTDTWPPGSTASELTQNQAINSNNPTKYGDVVRLRMGVGVSGTAASSVAFKLQYAADATCSINSNWVDLGPIGSTTALWRGYNNAAVADGATLPSSVLSGTNVLETYEEENNTAATPNSISVGQYGEWDWVLENRATPGTSYCFRMVTPDGNRLKTYTNYPQLVTNQSPTVLANPVPFDNEKLASTSPWFEFTGVDPEGEELHYQIQIDNDADFSSMVANHNSLTHSAYFENQVILADKSPFNDSQEIRYIIPTTLTNGTTYWWRVRAVDPSGSTIYGEWTTPKSFTIDTSTTISTWFQTTQEQFETGAHLGTEATTSDSIVLAGGSSVGTTTSTLIDFDWGAVGNAWGQLSFNETGAANDILYHIQYYDGDAWQLIPDGALSGNAAGFDSSPVDLIDLDTETYNEIRIQAVFTNGSPSVLDWTVTWGLRVAVVTHESLFDNEKLSTTSPTFVFWTTDPDGDDLEYEFSWSTDYTFASGSTTVNSSTSPGFVNLDSGGDTTPFFSGDQISYKIQTALTNGLTYWWRVRARDPNAGNSYSFWSDPWSFTVDSTATTSTWFQTTEEQFETDIFASVIAFASDSVSTVPAAVTTYNFSGVTNPSATHVARDFEVDVNDPTDPPTGDAIDTLTTLGTSGSTPNLRSGIAGYASDAEALNAEYTAIASSDDSHWTITDPGNGDNAVFWASFEVAEDPANIDQIDVTVEGYQGAATDVAWLGIWRPGSTTPYWQALDWFQQTGTDGTYTGTITTNISEYFDANNKVHIIFFNEDDNDSLFVDYAEVVITSNSASNGTLTGTALDFDDGSGPAWGEMSWNDSEPGGSSITYQLQYLNGVGTWQLIPDGDLAGNSSGFSTSPVDLSLLNFTSYNEIRPIANFTCNGASCPVLNDWTITWSPGLSISGTAYEYDGVTPTAAGSVEVAVNGVLQTGISASISAGSWTLDNVTFFADDVVTVFVSGASDVDEAAAVTIYDGSGDITGMRLQKGHLSIGSDDNSTVTNAQLGQYDFTNDEDLFFDVNGSNQLNLCADTGCSENGLYVLTGNTFTAGANVTTHDMEVAGRLISGANTIRVSGSWANSGTTTMTGSTVILTATSTSESIDSTGAAVGSFNNLTLGETSGTATWNLLSALDVNGGLQVNYGTLARGSENINIAGALTTGASGFWTGVGTTTFDGTNPSNWTDNNATKQNIGYVVVDGNAKVLVLQTDTAMQSLTIGANDIFDLNNRTTTVYEDWTNNNTFTSRSGTVVFAATTGGQVIAVGGDSFYNVTFNGVGGSWSFTEALLTATNDFVVATGTVTLATGTTTIGGSFDATGGTFAHNNGTLLFNSADVETITFDGDLFSNVTNNLTFDGFGSWTITDINATSSGDVLVEQGTVNFPAGVLAIGGRLADTGGVYVGGSGTVRFYSTVSEVLTAGGSSFNHVVFDGTGSWSFSDVVADINGDLLVQQGTLTLPATEITIGGSYNNSAVVNANNSLVTFDSTDGGETINFGNSSLHNVEFDSLTGGWTLTASATTTNNFSLLNANDWTLAAGQALSVGGVFTNNVGGASTTWTGSTLSLESGAYSINTKGDVGDVYNTLRIAANTDVSMWNSSATVYSIDPTGSLYSQDHNATDGDLYIFGEYTKTAGAEYWSYATDFDGASLSGSERQANVRFAANASATFSSTTVNIVGAAVASTTIANQGSGTYTVTMSKGTTTAQYYDFANLGATGVSLLAGVIVPSFSNGLFDIDAPGGSAITLSSTTIDANPAKQILQVSFSTSTAISANNVTQTDGVPASFWWFRNGYGNLYGENYDNDTGDPGSVRFDDSSLVITVAGRVYSDAGVTPIVGGTCDGVTAVVRVVVEGGSSYAGSCSNVDGTYNIPGVVVVGDPTLTIYLDNASGGERGSVVTRTPTADVLDLDIYSNRVIVRNEDVSPLTIANLSAYDNSDDSDLQFVASTSTTPDTLTVFAGNELFVFASSTFAPGGDVTLSANAAANSYDGTLYVDNNASFVGSGTSTYNIGGRLALDPGAVFEAASSSVVMTATTSGKSISASTEITLYDLSFTGISGAWNVGADIRIKGNMTVATGTVTGTNNIYIETGSVTGSGVLSLGGGTTTLAASNTLGGTNTSWTFYNLQLGDGVQVGTTTPVFTSTTTVSGRLTIEAAHYLDAGTTNWDLAGTGEAFVENGTFIEDTSTIRYSGAGADVLSTQYYNLEINAGVGSPTYTVTGLGLIVDGLLSVGGDAASTFDLNANDPLLDVNGDVLIKANGTFLASDIATTTMAADFDNNGTFTGNGGTIIFDTGSASNVMAGNSSFSNVRIDSSGDVTISEHSTTTGVFAVIAANTFTVSTGQVLAVGGSFNNQLGGAATTWTGSTLRLFGSSDYLINPKTTNDSYENIVVTDTTQPRLWNSSASSYSVSPNASLYSQDHANVDGDLYVWGTYNKTAANDYWSYSKDFDGVDLSGGNERKVDVYFASGASAKITGGSLSVTGSASASTTLQNQGSGSYGLIIGGTASTSFRFYEVRDISSVGLVLTGSPTVTTLAYGDLEVSQSGGTAMTVGGTVITANPAKTFTQNRFALNGVAGGFNVTATGTSLSSWRFANHYGDIDGEAFDVDPDGDPGYVAWDDSAALITIAGNVYSDEGVTVSGVCDGITNNVVLRVAGLTTYSTSCNASTGAYSIPNIAYGSTDSLVVYIDGETAKAATVTKEPVSNIGNMHLYESRVIVRHENTNAITIADMAVWDSSDDADIPFTAVNAGTDTLSLPPNRKLLVWNNKTFTPAGNVTVSGGGAGAAHDGTVQLYNGATWSGQGTEALSIGGSFILNSGAAFVASNGTTTFTTSGAGRTIDVNSGDFNNIAFTGSGSWAIADPDLTVLGNLTILSGALTLPAGTSTFGGSFINTGGSFVASGGTAYFSGTGAHPVTLGGSALAEAVFTAGTYIFGDTNATATKSITVTGGSVTLPSGLLEVGGNFRNTGGSLTHNTVELVLSSTTVASVLASSSDLYTIRFTGGGIYNFEDENVALLGNLLIDDGFVALASGTMSIGGSFDASGGTFDHASGTLLFNSTGGGEVIDPGTSNFYSVQISAPTGGYTLSGGATTTNNFNLASANSFAVQSGSVLRVGGVFTNLVGGSNTTWSGSTLVLDGTNSYTINTKASGGDQYENLTIGTDSDIRMWNSAATTTTVDVSSSLYSQDNASVNGALYIYGDLHISTTTEYWSYATDFDGTDLSGGSERVVTVYHAVNATTTVDGGSLQMVGASGNVTTVTNQGAGTYAMRVSAGTLNASYYAYRNLNASGLVFTGIPTINSLSYGDFELAVNGGTLITLASTTLNANASMVIPGNRFATTTAITGYNVTLSGSTSNAWTFTGHTGNLDGEDFDVDGATACGSIRWSDSSCLLTQQTNYRWRNDDGGLGVPNSEWYNASWNARQYVRIVNDDATTYANAAVKLVVSYDTDMQADFDDLRFTAADGVTLIPHWIGSTTNSAMTEVWVKVASLPAESTTDVYMYYNHPTATTTSSSTQVFVASDDFEDNNISEYSGQTGLFATGGSFTYDGSYGLDNAGSESSRANLGGIFRFDQTVSQGETFRFLQYVDTTAGSGDETCTLFGVQSPGTTNQNYAVCLEQFGTDRISLVRDAVDNDASGTILGTSTVAYSTGWYEVEVDWGTDDSLFVSLYDASGTLVATTSATDSTYTSGGFGFTFWFHNGGWDGVSSRPTLTTEPTIYFGSEQTDGGASWQAAQNTAASFSAGEVARLRLSIENSGLPISNQQFLLEYAELGAAPSCAAVNTANFTAVPAQASCGTSPVCMQASPNVTNGAVTADLLNNVSGNYVAGQFRENPTNITTNLNIDQDEYTELEYAVTPTTNVTDDLCFRVTNNGSELDTYLQAAHMAVSFVPVIDTVVLNNGSNISLIPGTTTRVYATGTVSDLNGFSDLQYASSTIYRSGVAGGAACSADNNNCYVSATPAACQFINCAGNSCTVSCYADIYFHADPTDAGSTFEGQEWLAFVEVEDTQGGYDFASAIGVELNTLRAIDVSGAIDYGALAVNSDTGAFNASTSVLNLGNVGINLEISGTDLSDGSSSLIPADQQKFATSTFTYSACGSSCELLSSTTPTALNVDLAKPSVDTPPVSDDVYWGISVPIGVNSVPHQGINVFTPISP